MDWTHSYNVVNRFEQKGKDGQGMGYDKKDRIEEYRTHEQDKGIVGKQEWLKDQKRLDFLTEKKIEGGKGEQK